MTADKYIARDWQTNKEKIYQICRYSGDVVEISEDNLNQVTATKEGLRLIRNNINKVLEENDGESLLEYLKDVHLEEQEENSFLSALNYLLEYLSNSIYTGNISYRKNTNGNRWEIVFPFTFNDKEEKTPYVTKLSDPSLENLAERVKRGELVLP